MKIKTKFALALVLALVGFIATRIMLPDSEAVHEKESLASKTERPSKAIENAPQERSIPTAPSNQNEQPAEKAALDFAYRQDALGKATFTPSSRLAKNIRPPQEGGMRDRNPAIEPSFEIALINGNQAVANQLLIKLKGQDLKANEQLLAEHGLIVKRAYKSSPSLFSISLDTDEDAVERSEEEKGHLLSAKIKQLMKTGNYEYAEPDWVVSINAAPTDPSYVDGSLWGLKNTGQDGGQAGVDINVEPAWEITRGSSDVVVAVIDTGIRYTHQDLKDNMWINTAEIAGNGLDDDGNGYIDDIYGYDTENNDGDPMDDHNHGTHCAGTIAATADDSGPIVGVAPNVKLMACKFLNASGNGSSSGALAAVEYAVANGADILSNSWGGLPYSQALNDAIEHANRSDVLFVAAAGNDGKDNDASATYPADYEVDNVISVAAMNRNGGLANFSNYGLKSVDIGAPGVAVLSSTAGSDESYSSFNGTSMACPHVAGVAALLKSHFPNISINEYKSRLYQTVTPLNALQGKSVTGGMVNSYEALTIAEDGVLEVNISHAIANLIQNEATVFFISVTDVKTITGATVTAILNGNGSSVSFFDNGIAPDKIANDGVYSATITVPATTANELDLAVTIVAAGKDSFSAVNYNFATHGKPVNDDIADATELTGNSGIFEDVSLLAATGEIGERFHAGSTTTNSVWYKYTATDERTVSIETTDLKYSMELAVYTLSGATYTLITGTGYGEPDPTSGSINGRVAFTT